jgi:hypothetical protein
VAAPLLELTSVRLATCPGDIYTISFKPQMNTKRTNQPMTDHSMIMVKRLWKKENYKTKCDNSFDKIFPVFSGTL